MLLHSMTLATVAALYQMSNALADHIRASWDRAAEAERLASREIEPAAKAELLELARGWRQVAVSYEYVQKLENFLKVHKAFERPLSAH